MKSGESHWGHKVGVLTPATNVTVEEELWSMRVPSATISTSRIKIDSLDWSATDGMQKFVEGVASRLPETVARLQLKPDSLLLGISSSTLWGGLEGNEKTKRKIKDATGYSMVTPSDAIIAAAKKLNFKTVGVVTPYPSVADERVKRFFGEIGVSVTKQKGMRADNPVAIGEISESDLKRAIQEVDADGVDAIVQLGTDLKMARVASWAEKWLEKPVLSINATTWWHTLRVNGISDKIYGWGALLESE